MKVYYADDRDSEKAGQGLAAAPYIDRLFGTDASNWMMSPSEQVALIYLLEHTKPAVAIEIGTRLGGSLQVLSHYCGKVYSLDIDPDVPKRLRGKHDNVEFIIGSSVETLPPLLEKLQRENAPLGFVLVDGDHSAKGVKSDIDNLMKFHPTVPMSIVMHDSFNGECREGLRTANWASNPYVQAVELDFVSGTINPSPAFRGQAWGGLALAWLTTEKRSGRFEVTGRSQLTLDALNRQSFSQKVIGKAKRILSRLR